MNKEFQVHMLNQVGKDRAIIIAESFDALLEKLKELCPDSREFSICRTKLEEAAFFAKKAMVNCKSPTGEPINSELPRSMRG